MTAAILTLNAGSSSLKFALFAVGDMALLLRGEVTQLESAPCLVAIATPGAAQTERRWAQDEDTSYEAILLDLLTFVRAHGGGAEFAAVGHRIVHGGPDHVAPALVSADVLDRLEALTPFDPLHLPHNLAPLRIIATAYPTLPQVACFDTAFHHTMPAVAQAVALPASFAANGVRRYGFHGLSYEFIARRLSQAGPDLTRGRVIVAHLGAGASLCALQDGISIATTMGFSVLDGLVMATRCGSIDPGVILYLGRTGHSFADIEDMLYRRSGLLGQSGISGDMEVLLASGALAAQAAIELFTYRVALEVGSLVSALGGMDALIFTAGIGEHSAAIRAAICARLEWLGLRIDAVANADLKANRADRISTADSKVEVRVIATDEEAMIAQHTHDLIFADAHAVETIDG